MSVSLTSRPFGKTPTCIKGGVVAPRGVDARPAWEAAVKSNSQPTPSSPAKKPWPSPPSAPGPGAETAAQDIDDPTPGARRPKPKAKAPTSPGASTLAPRGEPTHGPKTAPRGRKPLGSATPGPRADAACDHRITPCCSASPTLATTLAKTLPEAAPAAEASAPLSVRDSTGATRGFTTTSPPSATQSETQSMEQRGTRHREARARCAASAIHRSSRSAMSGDIARAPRIACPTRALASGRRNS
mmetsp:Transcript_97369/g.270961  ORF Transcript_97369/g.270961 Transcript_97369/m.270961 type:complete len:244 (-) Transcript_97369:156-887(-)